MHESKLIMTMSITNMTTWQKLFPHFLVKAFWEVLKGFEEIWAKTFGRYVMHPKGIYYMFGNIAKNVLLRVDCKARGEVLSVFPYDSHYERPIGICKAHFKRIVNHKCQVAQCTVHFSMWSTSFNCIIGKKWKTLKPGSMTHLTCLFNVESTPT